METGLTELEAKIYLILLKENKVTGYQVAKALGKPSPNIYKALNNLVKKGAAREDNSNHNKYFSAVPVKEYITQLQEGLEFEKNKLESSKKTLELVLSQSSTKTTDEGIYKLKTLPQVISKTKEMINKASQQIIITSVDSIISNFAAELKSASANGISILVQGNKKHLIENINWVNTHNDLANLSHDLLNIAVDGKESLFCIINKAQNEVMDSYWVNNRYLSIFSINSLLDECLVSSILDKLFFQKATSFNSLEDFKTWLNEYFMKYCQNIKNARYSDYLK